MTYKRLAQALAGVTNRRLVQALVCTVLLAAAGGVWWLTTLDDGLPNDAAIRRIEEMAQATSVFDRSDALAFTIFREQRIEVPLSQVSRNVQLAILSVEDRRFFEHSGFDLVRILSSVWANIRELRLAQGGSTITQQLARQSFLTPQKTIRRKFQELIVARRIERAYTKQQILELYLNKIYFGDGLHGIEAASRGYFDKHAADLTIAEAALLAGLVKSPSNYAPTAHLDRAKARRGVVLDSMLEMGVITKAEWDEARTSPIALHDGFHDPGLSGQYFKEQVRQELVERFGVDQAYASGLRVFTTIDVEMQKAAEAAIATSLTALEEERAAAAARRKRPKPAEASTTEPPPPLQAALIALDPANGHVLAIVGGRDFEESSFNRATSARRQPGSAFKPFVYAAALEAGYSPATVLDRLNEPIETKEGEWSPEDEHLETTTISLRDALRTSSNRAAVRLMTNVGIDATVQLASQVGMKDVPRVPSLALGSGEVTLDALTAGYATFANGGRRPTPRFIRRIEDRDGRVIFTMEDEVQRVVSDKTAFLMASMLAGVIDGGTASRARTLGFTLAAGGKTGTTTEYKDAWFVGFTPSLVAGVWVGFDEPQTIMPNGYASDVAVPAWSRFMKAATEGNPSRWFSAPKGVTMLAVCRLSGKLATGGCDHVPIVAADGAVVERSMVYKEYFAAGTEPVDSCSLHARNGFLNVLASAVGASRKPAPVRPEDTGIPLPSRDTSIHSTSPVPSAQADPPGEAAPQKRGFWSRLFGRGKDKK
jgi:penicillin-binding protein 1A